MMEAAQIAPCRHQYAGRSIAKATHYAKVCDLIFTGQNLQAL
jgi:hypothetical protein